MKIAKIIETGEDMHFDLDRFLVTRGLIQAGSGFGKSYAIRKLLEETHGKVQQIVLDSEGEYSTLREKYDYLLIGKGKDVDVQIDIRSAEMIAKKILELRVSVIIDLYELKSHERKIFVRRFFEALVNIKKDLWHSVIILLDESDVYAPEKSAGKAESLQSVVDLACRGRKRGQCLVAATQRIAKLNKDVTAELQNRFIGGCTQDIDRKRAGEELGYTTKEAILSLRNMKPGEFNVFGPAINPEIIKIKINPVKTTHPEAGKRIGLEPTPPTDKIKAMLSKLVDLPKKVEEELREKQDYVKKIRSLEVQLRQKPKPEVDKKQMEYIQKRMESEKIDAFNKGKGSLITTHKIEINNYKKTFQIFENKLKNIGIELRKFISLKDQFVSKLGKLIAMEVPKIPEIPKEIIKTLPYQIDDVNKGKIYSVPEAKKEVFEKSIPNSTYGNEEGELTGSQQKILDNIAKLSPVMDSIPKPIVAAYSGFSNAGGGFHNNLSKLRIMGYIDYKNTNVILTELGQTKINVVESPGNTEELQQMWRNLLSDFQKKIFDVLIEIYPDQISREELAERTDFSNTGGGFHNNISRLKVMQIAEYPEQGMVKATNNIFLE